MLYTSISSWELVKPFSHTHVFYDVYTREEGSLKVTRCHAELPDQSGVPDPLPYTVIQHACVDKDARKDVLAWIHTALPYVIPPGCSVYVNTRRDRGSTGHQHIQLSLHASLVPIQGQFSPYKWSPCTLPVGPRVDTVHTLRALEWARVRFSSFKWMVEHIKEWLEVCPAEWKSTCPPSPTIVRFTKQPLPSLMLDEEEGEEEEEEEEERSCLPRNISWVEAVRAGSRARERGESMSLRRPQRSRPITIPVRATKKV